MRRNASAAALAGPTAIPSAQHASSFRFMRAFSKLEVEKRAQGRDPARGSSWTYEIWTAPVPRRSWGGAWRRVLHSAGQAPPHSLVGGTSLLLRSVTSSQL